MPDEPSPSAADQRLAIGAIGEAATLAKNEGQSAHGCGRRERTGGKFAYPVSLWVSGCEEQRTGFAKRLVYSVDSHWNGSL